MGDDALISLLSRFLDGMLDVTAFEREFLEMYKKSPVQNQAIQRPLGRAFLAVEGYDTSVTPKTETVHNLSYETMIRELRAAWDEIEAIRDSPNG